MGPAAWPCAASRSSTSPAAISRSATRTAGSRSSRTARSTTTASCTDELRGQGHTLRDPQRHRGAGASLRGATARTSSSALRGMFAIAIWDARRGRLVLARDRFGIKPLYYRVAGGAALLRLRAEGAASPAGLLPGDRPRALEAFLAFNSIPAPLTIFAEARKLPAGHTLIAEGGEVELRRYARPAPVSAEQVRTEPEEALAEELRGRLRDSVRAHLVSDVPVGVLLSGGIDSATLTALAAAESGYRVQHLLDRLRGAVLRRARARAPGRASATAPTTTSWCSARTRWTCSRGWSRPSTSPSQTPRRCRRTWSRSLPRTRSRSCSRARAATSSSAATTPTSPTGWRHAWPRRRR